jgi:hypothetical protein
MFSVLKFIWILFKAGKDLVNPNINPLRHAPVHIKYFASILLGCFWSLAFGLYIGELLTIGYNMLGHIAIISMVFGTWAVFRSVEHAYGPRDGTVQWLRAPDHSSRCDEMTDQERLAKVKEWNNRDIWNDPTTSKEQQDNKQYHFYGS